MKGTITIEVLKPASENIHIPAEVRELPAEFFKTRKGLYAYGILSDRFTSKASPIVEGKEFSLESFDLVRTSTDNEICLALENKNDFSESDLAAILTSLISKQPNGEEGPLLTTGYANLFYTPSCVVRVFWYGVEWYVSAWERGGGGWGAGGRVFSPRT